VETDYIGPHLDGDINIEFMKELIRTFKDQRKLHTKYAYKVGSTFIDITNYGTQLGFCVDSALHKTISDEAALNGRNPGAGQAEIHNLWGRGFY
jgi:hypothetical protein